MFNFYQFFKIIFHSWASYLVSTLIFSYLDHVTKKLSIGHKAALANKKSTAVISKNNKAELPVICTAYWVAIYLYLLKLKLLYDIFV